MQRGERELWWLLAVAFAGLAMLGAALLDMLSMPLWASCIGWMLVGCILAMGLWFYGLGRWGHRQQHAEKKRHQDDHPVDDVTPMPALAFPRRASDPAAVLTGHGIPSQPPSEDELHENLMAWMVTKDHGSDALHAVLLPVHASPDARALLRHAGYRLRAAMAGKRGHVRLSVSVFEAIELHHLMVDLLQQAETMNAPGDFMRCLIRLNQSLVRNQCPESCWVGCMQYLHLRPRSRGVREKLIVAVRMCDLSDLKARQVAVLEGLMPDLKGTSPADLEDVSLKTPLIDRHGFQAPGTPATLTPMSEPTP